MVEDCRAAPGNHIQTLAGRKRYLAGIAADGRARNASHLRAAAERQAVNTLCQGSAADIAKLAMIRLHGELQAPAWRGAARMVLMVHDELVFEVATGRVRELARVVKGVMEGVAPLRVPLPVKLAAGPSWGELSELPREIDC